MKKKKKKETVRNGLEVLWKHYAYEYSVIDPSLERERYMRAAQMDLRRAGLAMSEVRNNEKRTDRIVAVGRTRANISDAAV